MNGTERSHFCFYKYQHNKYVNIMKLKELSESGSAQEKFDAVVYNKRTRFCHESEAPAKDFYETGITDLSTFCTVNKESNFVTAPSKTRIWFWLPRGAMVVPDMRYDDVEDLVEQHPQINGADVSINTPISIKWIERIETVTAKGTIVNWNVD